MALPSGYTQLQYIQSSGTQYIDTGVVAADGFRATLDILFTSLTTKQDGVLGSHGTSAPYQTNCFYIRTAGFELGVGDGDVTFGAPKVDTRYALDFSTVYGNVYFKIDGVSQNFSINATNDHCNSTLYLFFIHGGDKWFGKCCSKFYGGKIYVSDVLVRDYVPCRGPAGEVGLYDDVNQKFYGNSGTGTFVAGPEVVTNPGKELTLLEYIQSSGTQYINTGFKPNQNTKVSVVYHSTSSAAGVVAADNGWLKNGFGIFTQTVEYGTSSRNHTPVDRERTVSLDRGKIVIDGEQVATYSGTFQTTSELVICALNRSGVIQEYMTGKLYSCQIYDNGALVRDYVPALRKRDGVVGLYDSQNNVFYTNSGSGVFTAGPIVGPTGSRTLIDAVDYQIKNGKCMISGAVYGNHCGKVMVDGVVYDILLEPNEYLITIIGNGKEGSYTYASVIIDGIEYTSPGEITIPVGKTITLEVSSYSAGDIRNTGVYVDGEKIGGYGEFDYTPSGNITVELVIDRVYSGASPYGEIFVTTD